MTTHDRLAEIEARRDCRFCAFSGVNADADIGWLIAEVKRLRAELEDYKQGAAEEARAGDEARTEVARLREFRQRTRDALASMTYGWQHGDRDGTLNEYMEGRDWEKLWALAGEFADHSPVDLPLTRHSASDR